MLQLTSCSQTLRQLTPFSSGEVQLQVSTFSDDIGAWEPLLEPVMQQEEAYRPYEVLFKVCVMRTSYWNTTLRHSDSQTVVYKLKGMNCLLFATIN